MAWLPALGLKRWLQTRRPSRRTTAVRTRRLQLECLEDRTLLSGVTVTPDTSPLLANATTIVINGSGFDPIVANNSVVFDDGAAGTVTAATATALTVEFSADPLTAGNLSVVVTADSVDSGAPVQVATVTPVVTTSTTNLAANAATLTIDGFGFDPTAGNNAVVLDDGAAGTVTAATPTELTVTLSTEPVTAGNLTAVVATNTVSSGATVQVATVMPVVTSSAADVAADTATLTID